MAEVDWDVLTGSKPIGEIDRGVTAGLDKPNGGGTFIFGFNSLVSTPGAVGLHTNQLNFSPTTLGGRMSGALKRGVSSSPIGFSPMLFFCLQGVDVSDLGYLLGLSNADPHHIALVKGPMENGIGDDIGVGGVLAIGTAAIVANTWKHLRLDIVVNDNGDVILLVFENDLDVNPVTSPIWVPVPGMDTIDPGTGQAFIDDTLGINSGSSPFLLGRIGFGFQHSGAARRGFADHVQVARQT